MQLKSLISKRIVLPILSALFTVSLFVAVSGTAAANPSEYAHSEQVNAVEGSIGASVFNAACSHSYSWVTTKSATCVATGVSSYKCSKCGYVSKTKTISALGHSFKSVVTKQATCTTTGTYEYRCSRCNSASPNGNGSIPATGHKWNRSSATCTEAKKCTKCGYISQPMIPHSLSWKTKSNATCTSPRIDEEKCSVCGYVRNTRTSGSALGHDLVFTQKYITYNANNHFVTCRRCNKNIAYSHNMQIASYDNSNRLPAQHTLYCKISDTLQCGCHYDTYCHDEINKTTPNAWQYYKLKFEWGSEYRIAYVRRAQCPRCGVMNYEFVFTQVSNLTSIIDLIQGIVDKLIGYIPVLDEIEQIQYTKLGYSVGSDLSNIYSTYLEYKRTQGAINTLLNSLKDLVPLRENQTEYDTAKTHLNVAVNKKNRGYYWTRPANYNKKTFPAPNYWNYIY